MLYPDPELSFKTKMADIPLIIQEKIFGNKIDDNGVLDPHRAATSPPYFAVGFTSARRPTSTYRYVWLYKVRAKPVTETYATKEGTRPSPARPARSSGRPSSARHDGRYQAVADEGRERLYRREGRRFPEHGLHAGVHHQQMTHCGPSSVRRAVSSVDKGGRYDYLHSA